MRILQDTNWSKINEAYQIFISGGQLPDHDVLRPEIAASWQRSRNNKPWTIRAATISDQEFNWLLEENAALMKVAKPVMQYMYATNNHFFEDNYVQLCDKTGVILDVCMRVCDYPSPVKKRISEDVIGTNLTALVLYLKKPFEAGGQELFKVCYHTCFGGGAPIKDASGALVGAVSLYNNFGKIPQQPLEFVQAGAHLIAKLYESKMPLENHSIETHPGFSKMIDYIEDYILIIDMRGVIVNVNKSCVGLLGLHKTDIIAKNCSFFDINLEEIILDKDYKNKDAFTITAHHRTYNCLLHNNITVAYSGKEEHILLLFNTIKPQQQRHKLTGANAMIDSFEKVIGSCANHSKILNLAKRAARVPTNILIDGESGTGKEVFARAIHHESSRAEQPFVAINCGSIPKDIIQSDLFGYEEGAFTGSRKGGQIGKFEAADGGTILLDEIGEMPLPMQVSLLRFLQDKTVTRVGGQTSKKIDVRIIAATNRNLQKQVEAGVFRSDLYYRLKVIHITLPALRERKDDILLIADYYLGYFSKLYGIDELTITQETKNLLYQYHWPGNIRELANVIENVVVLSDSNYISPDILPQEILEYKPGAANLSEALLEQQEKEIIIKALRLCRGNISSAAKSIGISRNTLYRKIDKYGLQCFK